MARRQSTTRNTSTQHERERVEMATTAVNLPRDNLLLLRRVAVERANKEGGRPSVSAILARLIEKHRDELEAELRDLEVKRRPTPRR